MMLFKRDGYFHLEYFDSVLNKSRRKSLKTKDKKLALQRLTEFEKLIEQKKHIQQIKVSRFELEYKTFIQSVYTKKYLSSIEYSFRKLTQHLQNDVVLATINKRTAENFLYTIFRTSEHAAYLHLRTLKAAFNKAITWQYISSNPWKGIKLPKIPSNHPVFISTAELGTILSKIKELDIRDIIIVAYYTGMRLSEVLNLQWNSIDIKNSNLTVSSNEHFVVKNKKDRIIPIHPIVGNLLKPRLTKKTGEYIFSKSGILYRQEYISKKFKKAVRDAELPEKIHFHTLRHSFASNLVQNGISLYVVKELLGHSSISTTQIYSHLKNDNLVNAIATL